MLSTMHILVIEDDPRLADLLAQLLTGDRHVVEVAATGRDGLDLAAAGGVDAIVLDVGLPDISGPRGRPSDPAVGQRRADPHAHRRATPSRTGWPGSTPAPTTTSSSRSPSRS